MNTYRHTRIAVLLGLLIPLTFSLTTERASAQASLQTLVYEAPLTGLVDGQPVRKGTAQATLDGHTLRLFAAYSGLRMPESAAVGANLYRGDPAQGGTLVESLVGALPASGGFETTKTLTPDLLEDLQHGRLYLNVRVVNYSPHDELNGQLQLQPSADPDFMETPLSLVYQGHPAARGGMRAMLTAEGLRLLGYFHGLASNWQQVTLYRGAHGTEGEQIASIYNLGGSSMSGGIDHTLPLEAGWEQALQDGHISVAVETGRASDGLRGRLLPATNEAPEASQVRSPAHGETVVIGGTGGADPVDPDVYLATISFAPAQDPDDDPVGYLWQASLRPGFNGPETVTFDLGVDSTRVPLTVADAAALFDTLTGARPGDVLLDTPVTIYHRVLTTDGARYTIGEAVEVTFIRGTVTSSESPEEAPGPFALAPNYPNPFNPSTHVAFTLQQRALIRLAVYDGLGRRLAVLVEGMHPAGTHRVTWDAAGLPSGVYLVRLEAPGFRQTRTVTLAK